MHVLLEANLEGVVKSINLFDQVHLHGLLLFDVLVSSLLFLSEEVVLDGTKFSDLLFLDRLDHFLELLSL